MSIVQNLTSLSALPLARIVRSALRSNDQTVPLCALIVSTMDDDLISMRSIWPFLVPTASYRVILVIMNIEFGVYLTYLSPGRYLQHIQ